MPKVYRTAAGVVQSARQPSPFADAAQLPGGTCRFTAGIHLPCNAKHVHTDYCHVYGFHTFRYGSAQNNSERMTKEQLQEQMGHRSSATTEKYVDYAKR